MKMRQLEAFHAVMVCGTLTRAAESLYTSQPSISRMLTDLEYEIGFPLFERQKGRVRPTPEGVAFFEELKLVIESIGGLSEFAKKIKNQRTGHIDISVTPALSLSFLPPILAEFRKKYPDSVTTISVRDPGHIYSQLRNGTTDIAFSNGFIELPNVAMEILAEAQFVCALPPGHPLETKDAITPEDISGEDFIMLIPEKEYSWAGHDNLLKKMKEPPKSVCYTQRSMIAYAMVAQGLGLSILEPFSAAHWEKSGVVIKPFFPELVYNFYIFFPRDKIRSMLARSLSNIALEYLRANPLPFQNSIQCDIKQ